MRDRTGSIAAYAKVFLGITVVCAVSFTSFGLQLTKLPLIIYRPRYENNYFLLRRLMKEVGGVKN